MKNILLLTGIVGLFLVSCSNGSQKLIVYSNNGAAIDEASKVITVKDTFGHNDKEINFSGGNKKTLTVKLSSGDQNIDIDGAGYFIVNAKARDTIIGGFQKYSTVQEANRVMTQEELAHNIDSLKQMMTGANTNVANKTFFILPYTAAKITDNTDAFIVGPYHRMTSIEKVGDKDPEVYRFYSVREVRETIDKLEKLTGAKPAEDSTGKKK
ncbi:hypothetical protein FRZ67_11300 [Panacibacter ginsenosidivorans]|uniref:Uncharacterized protein n=1 Tax=Panacibacter ginsenosidivorans TaxID=1813871 RepID=A0A5B8V9N5_9BACT|nr:hypothetical protein [Panacibacter ginsenosidivorans]QEC67855.1 hypothetical protein FRZ67_11300 [Panacibacter ginsenosidivorans]